MVHTASGSVSPRPSSEKAGREDLPSSLYNGLSSLLRILLVKGRMREIMIVFQAPKSIALGFAPCLLEGTREVAVMKMMPNK